MDISHLRCFALVAEELHITRASQRLQMAQPSLSRIIRGLEEELGFALFDRDNKRKLALTPAGQAFWEQLTPALAQYDKAIQEAQRIVQGKAGKLVVGYVPTAMFSSILPEVVGAYEGDAEAELVLRDFSTQSYQAQVKALREHRLDVLFVLKPFDEPGIMHSCVTRTSAVCVLPVGHRLARLDAIPLTALAEEAWVWMSRSMFPRGYDEMVQLCRQAGFEPRIVQTVPQVQAIISLVAGGMGISIVTAWSQKVLQQQSVVYRPLLNFSYEMELHVLWRQHDGSSLLRTFLSRCKRELEAS